MSRISIRTMLLACLLASLPACSKHVGAASPCAAFIPVYINGTDAISDQTARPILSNNETGHELCGWEYSSKPQEGTAHNHIGTMTQ